MPDRPQTLPSGPERDEAAGYRPVSALAVAALMVAGGTTLAVLVTWAMAWFVRRRPILVWQLLVLAAVGLVLALIAVRHVRRSEGSRTGWRLALTAMWLSVFSLGGYGAYYFAIDAAVRQQAEAAARQFFDLMGKSEPELAFRLTRDPGQQRGIEADPKKIRDRFGATDFHQFWLGDLARMFRTWPDKARVRFVGAGERTDYPDGFLVQLNYVIRTPEGQYEVEVWTRGIDDPTTGGRDWQVLYSKTTLKPGARLTLHGRICIGLQMAWAQSRFPEWNQGLQTAPPAEIARILRVEGAVAPDGQRERLIEEIKHSRAINPAPGSGPSRSPGLPTMYFDRDGVRFVQLVQVNAPAIDPQCPAQLTVQILGDDIVKELLRLSGPEWENQPLLSDVPNPSLLANYKVAFKVVELNLRPSLPRIAPAGPPGS